MKLRLLALAATAATALVASSANAAIVATFDPLAWSLSAGEVDFTQFETGDAPATLGNVIFNQPGFALSGTAQLVTGSFDGVSAAPAMPASSSVVDLTGRDGTQYLSVQAGESATLTLSGLTQISFYIGSLDGYNSLAFEYADGTFAPVMTGGWVTDNTIAQSNGDQQNGNTNGRLTLTFDKPVESVVLTSTTNAFEISDVAGIAAGVPEPASWALMILGFGGAGAALRGRRRQQASLAAA